VNWGAVTYRGRIYFDRSNNLHPGHANIDEAGDGDYDWFLETPGAAGIATGNQRDNDRAIQESNLPQGIQTLALEFSSRETVDHINDSSWWKTFRDDIDNHPELAQTHVRGKQAIVIGLLGFDNEHGNEKGGARVEVHPVWGLAIRVSDDGDPEDRWEILARNWGNEGSCSNGWDATGGKWMHNLSLPNNKMRFFLPSTLSPSAQVATDFRTNYGDAAKYFSPPEKLADGVLLSIQLPDPEKRKLFWGELRIKK
jgi:hypothetical protein